MIHTTIAPAPSVAERDILPALGFAPMPAVARILGQFQRDQLASFIEVAIGLLDLDDHEDNPDFAPRSDGLPGIPEDHEPGGDEEAGAWIEWQNMRGSQKRGSMIASDCEDDELAGDETDGNGAEDEECGWFAAMRQGPGCIIADPDKAVDDDGCDQQEGY